jgi:regulator of protease activity HflC (stomatin/prohibitin superfamily)
VIPVAIGAVALTVVLCAVRIVPLYQRAVVLRHGRVVAVRGPGPIVVIPGLESRRTVDLRVDVMEVQPQRGQTSDRVDVEVGAMLQYRVVDPEQAAALVSDRRSVMLLLAQMMLGKAIAEFDARCWRDEQDTIVACLEHGIRSQSELYGIAVTQFRLLSVVVPSLAPLCAPQWWLTPT